MNKEILSFNTFSEIEGEESVMSPWQFYQMVPLALIQYSKVSFSLIMCKPCFSTFLSGSKYFYSNVNMYEKAIKQRFTTLLPPAAALTLQGRAAEDLVVKEKYILAL